MNTKLSLHSLFALALAAFLASPHTSHAAQADINDVKIDGGLKNGKAHLTIEATLQDRDPSLTPTLYSTALEHDIQLVPDAAQHTLRSRFEILQGAPQEFELNLQGTPNSLDIIGDSLLDWSLRQLTNGQRSIILRTRKITPAPQHLDFTIRATQSLPSTPPLTLHPLTFSPHKASLLNGYLKLSAPADVSLSPLNISGLFPIDPAALPDSLRPHATNTLATLQFRFHGAPYSLAIQSTPTHPNAHKVVIQNFNLQGQLSDSSATFILTGVAQTKNPAGGRIPILSGNAALTEFTPQKNTTLSHTNQQYVLFLPSAGEFPFQLKWDAGIQKSSDWNRLQFQVAPSALLPITLSGLKPDTQFEFTGAARPLRTNNLFSSFLPPDGRVALAWKNARPESEGKLFFSTELLAQINVSPGLLRQISLLNGRIMQGELTQLDVLLRGPGNVTAVQGPQILSWNVLPNSSPTNRLLRITFNQPQRDTFSAQIHVQTELGAFPQSADTLQLLPQGATRSAGFFRIANEGAVRLEILQSTGLSQISPDQFPESDATKSAFASSSARHRFAFRFSGADPSLRIHADNVLPEISVSQLLAFHLGDSELALDSEFELDIREAPIRELLVRLPRGFSIARLNAPHLADFFQRDLPDSPSDSELRLVFAQPISGRNLAQLRLERNSPLNQTNWTLPKIEVLRAKSTRGYIALSADPGFRLTPDRSSELTDIATAFFPKKIPNIQAAFRITDAAWTLNARVDRLQQSIQVDAFHLFSIGEGIAYGSSTLNYSISGAPTSTLRVAISDDFYNVEFTGKEVRNWQKTTNAFLVQLNTPVSGPYTLLATYERPFKTQGDTLSFAGAQPLDAQSEQGHTLVVSAIQFQTTPSSISPNLLPLETTEVPSEYRLFFDAPILAAYRYSTRPFTLQLALQPLAQGETVGLVADRAQFNTRISKDGEILTDARYFIKNRGNPHLAIQLPPNTALWSVTVNGNPTSPVKERDAHLIPLPQNPDPNSVLTLELKLASRSQNPKSLTAATPIIQAPVLLAEWNIAPDAEQRLVYRRGSLVPASGIPDPSGFATLLRTLQSKGVVINLAIAAALTLLTLFFWRWASAPTAAKFSARHIGGAIAGLLALSLASLVAAEFFSEISGRSEPVPTQLSFLAPVQQPGSALSVQLSNLPRNVTLSLVLALAWPALIALAWLAFAWLQPSPTLRTLHSLGAWTLASWTLLRCPNSAPAFLIFAILSLFLLGILPAFLALFRVRPPSSSPSQSPPPSPASSPSTAASLPIALLAASLLTFAAPTPSLSAAEPPTLSPSLNQTAPIASEILQEIRVDEKFATATAQITWRASKNQRLPLLFEPAVLTRFSASPAGLQPILSDTSPRRVHEVLALQDGDYTLQLHYQIQISQRNGESGFTLPTQFGLINKVTLSIPERDLEISSPHAASTLRSPPNPNSTSSTASLVLLPVPDPWIGWKPRSRDVQNEKPVFFADFSHLFAPSIGLLDAVHHLHVRPAQGQLSELTIQVPPQFTITDVLQPTPPQSAPADAKSKRTPPASIVSLWRFDPDSRQLRINLSPAQSRPFVILIRSQSPLPPLPAEFSTQLPSLAQSQGQVGAVGLASGNEVQIDQTSVTNLTAINLEDFPQSLLPLLRPATPDALSLRRAYRYTDLNAQFTLKAAPVEPDVRIDTQETLSLSEDRVVLAAQIQSTITRAGIFRLSFPLPPSLDVESISGPALSHWTDLRTPDSRIITLHLNGKTEGQHPFNLTLAGPGLRATNRYSVPKLAFREASKQRGQLTIVPEQGMRLLPDARDGVSQLDPQKSGATQKGVLAFRLLQPQWSLSLAIEQVDAWVQVSSLQHIALSDTQARSTANLQYQIENTGLKSFRVAIPTNAENVRFRGDQVADFLPVPGSITNGLQSWDIKLHRRILGRYLLNASWHSPLPPATTNLALVGIVASDANLQRGFVTLQSSGRLQINLPSTLPATLQPAEWQSIPRPLHQDIPAASAHFTFRLVDPAFQLPVQLERREAAKLLPARVQRLQLQSVISDEGEMLTHATLEIFPNDKRLLGVALPKNARFWFAFVDHNGVWPWRENDRLLIPLDHPPKPNHPLQVELFFSSRVGNPNRSKLNLALVGPQFDLPLENIQWQVFLNEKWELTHWAGSLQFDAQATQVIPLTLNTDDYLQTQVVQSRVKTQAAEEMLTFANTLLEQGNPQQARRAFQNAFGLSTHDNAFNEDARVQLHNLKLQQALIGLNARQAAAASDPTSAANTPSRGILNRKDAAYTQTEAKRILDSNPADENAALTKLAERIVQQQEAATIAPIAIRATIPEHGRRLSFQRAVIVDAWSAPQIQLQARAVSPAPWTARLLTLAACALLLFTARKIAKPSVS